MKKTLLLLTTISIFIFTSLSVLAQDSTRTKDGKQQKHGTGFVDLDGDGYNDNAPDHDGDGIPNGLDPDYVKKSKNGFVDLDGDGINDNTGMGKGNARRNNEKFGNRQKSMNGQGTGMQDGSGQGTDSKGRTSKGKGRR